MTSSHLPEARVINPPFYFYGDYLDKLKTCIRPSTKWGVDSITFRDGTQSVQVMISTNSTADDLARMPRHQAIMPVWLSTQFNVPFPEIVWSVGSLVNALKRTEEGRSALVDRLIALCPYLELRMDKDSGEDGRRSVGEPNIPEMLGKLYGGTNGIDDMVLFGAHSYEAVQSLRRGGINVVPVSSAPLFADFINNELLQKSPKDVDKINPENLRIIALDKGSLQQNIYLSELIGLNPADAIVAFKKTRKGENVVEKSALIYGDMNDLAGKDVIVYDDIIDTFGSMDVTVNTLKVKCQCKSITVIASHGILSHPARRNIMRTLVEKGTIDRVIMSDSLPKPKYLFEGSEDKVHIVPSAGLLGGITQLLAESTFKNIMTDNAICKEYILEPMHKEVVWEEFKRTKAKQKNIVEVLT